MTDEPGAPRDAAPRHRIVRSPQNLAAGASLVALALFVLWATSSLEVGRLRAMGPGMLPRSVAALIGLVGLALVALSLLRAGEALGRWSLRGPVFVCLAVVAFALSIRTVGLALAGPLVAIVSSGASPETRVREIVIFGVVITAFCIALFRYALHLPIPILIIPGVVRL